MTHLYRVWCILDPNCRFFLLPLCLNDVFCKSNVTASTRIVRNKKLNAVMSFLLYRYTLDDKFMGFMSDDLWLSVIALGMLSYASDTEILNL